MTDKTEKLLDLLGYPATSEELTNYTSQINIHISEELKLESGDFTASIERENDGFALDFTDEAYFLDKGNLPIGKGKLFYSGIFFHSEGKDSYKEYKGILPFSLSFTDTHSDAVNKLGLQSWQRLADDGIRVISDRWDNIPDVKYRIHTTYDKQTGRISIICIYIPNK